ncbi:MAG: hypothetical protein MMC33_005301 [Icmadophila ericetorum]|nr:hypothetical protein [Icmadophila ericetorum]
MEKERSRSHQLLVPWVYDLGCWIFTLCLDIFFREIYPRGAWRLPRRGPVIIVAGPHANQFVDSVILMRILKKYANRRVSFLIAEKSMREPYIGTIAGYMGALPVTRAMDKIKPGKGMIYLPEPDKDPTLVRGVGTDFTSSDYMVSGSIILPKVGKEAPETESIAEILGSEELRLKTPFKSPDGIRQLTTKAVQSDQKGTTFKVAPHIDQSKMFDAVFRELSAGGFIGIFPEGGSHDRSDLLPLKAGAAIMALGALARDPDSGLSIIPCGMNYFHPNKFRSRAVIEFGHPVKVDPQQIEAYKAGGAAKRNAVGSLLETIYEGLAAVTQPSPDHETLQLVQATRRLYNPINKKLPLSLVIEFNRRLLKGYTKNQDDPRVIALKKAVLGYNRRLRALGIRDHQVEWGNVEERPWPLILAILIYRVAELLVLSIGTIPGLAMYWPIFVVAKVISVKKQRKALAGSVVKIQARDVVGTWKILVAAALAPALYIYYTVLVTSWLYYNRQDGYYSSVVPWWTIAGTYIPDWVPLSLFAISFFGLMIAVTFAALRFGEIGMDIIKSLPPLLLALNPRSSDSLIKLRAYREALSEQVTLVIDSMNIKITDDGDATHLGADRFQGDEYQSRLKSMPPSEPPSSLASSGFVKPLSELDSEENGATKAGGESRTNKRGEGYWELPPLKRMMTDVDKMEGETEGKKMK